MKNKKGEKPKKFEIAGGLLVIICLFLLISLISYHFGQRTKESNLCGPAGYYLANFLLKKLGLWGYSLVTLGFLWGFKLLLKKETFPYLKFTIFFIFLNIFLFPLLNLLLGKVPLLLNGFIHSVTNFSTHLLGRVGSFIILFGGLLVTVIGYFGIAIFFYLLSFGRFLSKVFLNLKKRKMVKRVKIDKSKIEKIEEETDTPVIIEKVVKEEQKARREIKGEEFQKEFLQLLAAPSESEVVKEEAELEEESEVLLKKLEEFGVTGKIVSALTGPVITRFEFEPAPGIKIQRIESLADDLALSLKAERIRILAPIPGKSAVGIEIPNKNKRTVHLRKILEAPSFLKEKSVLTFALGETITGEPYYADLAAMPHILIAGTTGSGKSVCCNSLISSIIFRADWRSVRFLTIDPKQLELPIYDPIPHLLGPTTTDPKAAIEQLDRIISVMEERYGEFARIGVRDIEGYNTKALELGLEKKPYIVVVVDELADLMIRAPIEIEHKITRLAQMSRAVGIHLILATQRPSVDVITGLIKANFPCRIAFQVASKTDSRTILDMNGAETLLGRGDMLFLPPGKGEPIRLHGAYISVEETKKLVLFWAKKYLFEILANLTENAEEKAQEIINKEALDILINKERAAIEKERQKLITILGEEETEKLLSFDYHQPLPEEEIRKKKEKERLVLERELDELFEMAARLVIQHKEASVSMLQRRLDVGWARAGRIIDQLEQTGIVGPYVGSKSRKVLVETEEELLKILAKIKK